jgi:hypothetical protein
MAYNSANPANDGFIADAPQQLRDNFEGIRTQQIVDAGTIKGLSPGNQQGQIPVSNGNVSAGLNSEKLQGKTPADFAPAGWVPPAATGSSHGAMSNTDKQKLDTIQTGAEVNQNAVSNVLVKGATIQSNSKMGTIELTEGGNITLTPDDTNKRVTIAVSGKVPNAAWADGAVNAGNADTVDGKHAVDFAPAGFGLGTSAAEISNIDLNTLLGKLQSGWYKGCNMPNAPDTGWWYLTHIAYSDVNWCTQYVTAFGSGNTYAAGMTFIRAYHSNAWTTWRQVVTTDQMPASLPASGGNADTVAGYKVSAGADANTVAMRDSNGYLRCNYINSSRGNEDGSAAASYLFDNGDGWIRKKTIGAVKSELGVGVFNFGSTISVSGGQGGIGTGGPALSGSPGSLSVLNQAGSLIGTGTYALSDLLQKLVTMSHSHGVSSVTVNCNCNCNCQCNHH